MAGSLTRSLTLAVLLSLPFAWAPLALAQDAATPKDDALDRLLNKLEEKESQSAPKAADAKPASDAAGAGKASAKSEGKPSDAVGGKDKALDSLLEKLGATDDKPTSDDKPRSEPGGAGGASEPGDPAAEKAGQEQDQDQGKGKKADPNALSGKAKDLDEHLEELTGKRRKKDRKKEGEEGGPLSQVVKEMREVEERLGKPDTGEETRKKQGQIIKQIETLIEQARTSTSQSRGKTKPGKPSKPGQQSGPPQDTAGTTGGQAPNARPRKRTDHKSLAGGRDPWGHLPAEERQEMANIFKEEPLPSRQDLIKRYYLAVSKKSLTRGEKAR